MYFSLFILLGICGFMSFGYIKLLAILSLDIILTLCYSLLFFSFYFIIKNFIVQLDLEGSKENMESIELQREHRDYRIFQGDGGEGVLS